MTAGRLALDAARIRQLFDLRSEVYARLGGGFTEDPYPAFHRLRQAGPVHEGTVGRLIGFDGSEFFQGLPFPERQHFSAFDFATCDAVLRDPATFSSSSLLPENGSAYVEQSMLVMDGEPHRRYRALVQPSFRPKRARWWIENWIDHTVHALIDGFERNGRADLNVEFCAAIPLLTICGSFGVSVDQALDIRAAVTGQDRGIGRFEAILRPIIAARRGAPRDDLISVLVKAEISEDGDTHALSDEQILIFSFLLLTAGSGTTWKQMGITLHALLTHPAWLGRVRADRAVLRTVVEEAVRWVPTDPVFARSVMRDVTLAGVAMPAGAIVHTCLGAANRDPAHWERPDEFDPGRSAQPHLAFGRGPHVCLGMHLARAEIVTAIGALLDRLPNLRLDPGAEAPQIIGLYERGPSAVPVIWG